MNFYVIQGIGFIGTALMFISFQQNEKKRILLIQAAAGIVFALHFLLLDTLTGMGMNLWEIPRNLIFAQKHNKKRQWILSAVFIAGFIALGALTWEGPYSAFPVFAMCISTVVFSLTNPRHIRFYSLFGSALWMTYNITVMSVAGILTESFVISSLLIAIYRFDIKKKSDIQDK